MDEREIDRIVAGVRIPDGLILMDQYREIFKESLDDLDRLDPTSWVSSMSFITSTVNRCYPSLEGCGSQVDPSRALDTVTALSYFVVQLVGRLSDGERGDFVYQEYEDFRGELGHHDHLTPWWDLGDEIAGLIEFFDGLDEPPFDLGTEDGAQGV